MLLGSNPTRSIFMIVGNYGDVAESDWLNSGGSTIKMTKKATDRNSKIAIVTGIIGSLLYSSVSLLHAGACSSNSVY